MKPVFSEFSYGFALTHELVNRFRTTVLGAPILPSLIDEGRAGGFDVGLPTSGWTAFLQFKSAQLMKRSTAKHWDEYGHGYFRFPIRPATYSDQHRLLLELADQAGFAHFVAYVAPAFHEINELNAFFLNERVAENSVWIPVRSIGDILDNDEHWVIFDSAADTPRLRSDWQRTVEGVKGEGLLSIFRSGPPNAAAVSFNIQFFDRLADTLASIGRGLASPQTRETLRSRDVSAATTCAYLARTLFDAELLLIPEG